MSDTTTERPHESKPARRAKRRLSRANGTAFLTSSVVVAVIDAALVWALIQFTTNRAWPVVVLCVFTLGLVNWAYLNPRAQASRWLAPGLILMAVFVVYPVVYTAYISLTNYQTGNLLDKEQAIERLEQVTILTGESGAVLDMVVYRNDAGDLALLVGGGDVEPFLATPRAGADEPIAPPGVLDDPAIDLASPPNDIGDYTLLSGLEVTGESQRLQDAVVDLPDGRVADVATLTTVQVQTGGSRFTYDAGSDTVYDAQTDRTCAAGVGTFFCDGVPEDEVQRIALLAEDTTIVCSNGTCDAVPLYAIDQSLAGWRQLVGFDNYVDIATNDRIRAPFLRVLVWNVVFAFATVLMTFGLGLASALALKSESMKGRAIYRSIYIVPYAIPAFLSIFVWRGLLNTDFGQVNGMLGTLGLPDVDWLGSGTTAMISVLVVNLWLGFPYMFLINSGALTSIPEELLEAARVDGAGAWTSFRMITLPLLLVSTAPLLIGAFAFNFNNFALIYLLTAGGPPLTGYDVPVGSTDILISFTFDIAAGSGRGSQFALASAIVVVIFMVLATTSALSFRLTKKLEEIYDT